MSTKRIIVAVVAAAGLASAARAQQAEYWWESWSPVTCNMENYYSPGVGSVGRGYGVMAVAHGERGRGIMGWADETKSQNFGVYGRTDSAAGIGLIGAAFEGTGVNYGVYGWTNSPNGFAGYFTGPWGVEVKSYFGGRIGIGTTDPKATLHISGVDGADGIMFPDGSMQTTAYVAGKNTVTHDKLIGLGGDDHKQYLLVARSPDEGSPMATYSGTLAVRTVAGSPMMWFLDDAGKTTGWVRTDPFKGLQLGAARLGGPLSLSSDNFVQCTNTSGTSYVSIYAAGFYQGSSIAFKSDVTRLNTMDQQRWLDQIAALRPATYLLKAEVSGAVATPPARHLGLIAEEMPKELLSAKGDSIDLYALTTSLTAAVQALKTQVDAQKSLVDAQNVTIEQLKRELAARDAR